MMMYFSSSRLLKILGILFAGLHVCILGVEKSSHHIQSKRQPKKKIPTQYQKKDPSYLVTPDDTLYSSHLIFVYKRSDVSYQTIHMCRLVCALTTCL